MRDVFRRWNQRRKLAKGRCTNCGAVLRDDAVRSFCSGECADAYQDKLAW